MAKTMAHALEKSGVTGSVTTREPVQRESATRTFAQELAFEMEKHGYSLKDVQQWAHIPVGVIRVLVNGGRLPTEKEHVGLSRCFSRLKHIKTEYRCEEDANKRSTAQAVIEKSNTPQSAQAPQTRRVVENQKASNDGDGMRASVVSQVELTAPAPKPSPAVEVEAVEHECPTSPLKIVTKSGEQFTAIEVIDPDLAALLLTGNVRNRSLSSVMVDSFARDMIAGNWRVTHQGIALDKDGRLLDGQHRLSAVVKSGVTIRTAVTYNADPESFRAVDMGRPRNSATILGFDFEGLKYKSVVTGALRVIDQFRGGRPLTNARYTYEETRALYDIFGKDVSAICDMVGVTAGIRQVAIVGALAYARPVKPEAIDHFTKVAVSRVNMDSAMVALWKASDRLKPCNTLSSRVELANITFRCLTASLKGEELQKAYRTQAAAAEESTFFRHWRTQREKKGFPL